VPECYLRTLSRASGDGNAQKTCADVEYVYYCRYMSPKEAPGKKNLSVILTENLVERAKNIVYWTPGVTLAGLVEEGLERAVERRERVNGGPFKTRPSNLQRGRPIALRDVRSKKTRAAAVNSDSQGLRRPTPKDRTRKPKRG
jgi:hypothetical protein